MIIRNVFYDTGVFKQYRSHIPVICVGNLSVGGTGKTPHVKFLLEHFLGANKTVGVLSRGYGRSSKGFQWVEINSKFKDTGDESIEIKKSFPNALVAVCESRVDGMKMFERLERQPDIVILDDAFQHRSLHFDYQVLLTTYHNPFYNDFVLPAGRLREPRMGSKRANAVVVTKCPETLSEADMEKLGKKISPKGNQVILYSTINYQGYYYLGDPTSSFKENTSGYHAYLFTGIANNNVLESELNRHFKEVFGCYLADHHHFNKKDIEQLENKILADSNQKKVVIVTEKDATKLDRSQFSQNISVLVLRITPNIQNAKDWLEKLNVSVFENR